jgi:hypothetical protein
MHLEGPGNRRVSRNFRNRPGGRGGSHVEGLSRPKTFRVVGNTEVI